MLSLEIMKTTFSFQETFVRIFVALSLLVLIGLTACNETEDPTEVAEITADEITLAQTEEEMDVTMEDAESVALEAIEMTAASSDRRIFSNPADALLSSSCAVVTHDSINKTISIDFGTGCVGPDGKTRSGIVLISYTQRLWIPGASLSISLNNYAVDGKAIEGTKTLTNVSANLLAPISMNATLTGGKVTWPDGTFATREYTRTRTWIRGANPLNDEFRVSGEVSGMTRAGENYQIKILSTVIYKRSCRLQGVGIAVQGIKRVQRDTKPDLLIDYGDGQCDHLITLTRNGNSIVVDVSQ